MIKACEKELENDLENMTGDNIKFIRVIYECFIQNNPYNFSELLGNGSLEIEDRKGGEDIPEVWIFKLLYIENNSIQW